MSFLGEPFKHDLFVSYSHGEFEGSGESNLKTLVADIRRGARRRS